VSDAVGLTQFSVNRVEMAPGASTALRHWHEEQDEFVLVIAGEVVLVEEGRETVLGPGDCAGFKAGVANGHCFENRSTSPVILFEIGANTQNENVHYPDADLRVEKRGDQFSVLHRDGRPY
jgi:uncharacterized cupin superfamily protein